MDVATEIASAERRLQALRQQQAGVCYKIRTAWSGGAGTGQKDIRTRDMRGRGSATEATCCAWKIIEESGSHLSEFARDLTDPLRLKKDPAECRAFLTAVIVVYPE